ncbi:hypothetical protein KIV56_04695 [Cryobacterium breve]|jgi:hypothetical protein|uniref:Bacitracin resistance protein n=1 Tax=Cryobacterium breve TaxID=1259258 RepID=A0ABY7NEI7_9MICO|nr:MULTISPECIES: hypothetical protein [Cryobacterium]MDY7544360.1 hypothetical protein [Cryobacterium sp. 5B3]MEA9998761.1 hypothetical protein [Cryobacterium sp. RTS3]MEB0266281.1 hypothetical protein [Cryobacterium sp. 10I5]MEB0274136.1 hypothetical protein [Cryobacterium sp. 5B3]WBM80695.1 hypothetical protein KIV56_04695 [Cryobacterium breve]
MSEPIAHPNPSGADASGTATSGTGSTGSDAAATRRRPSWPFLVVAVFFGLFYAWDVWAALGNLIGLNLAAGSLDTRLSGFGWGILIAGVLLPILVFLLAARIGRGRPLYAQAALFLVGLALASALALDIYQFGLGSLIV